MKSYPLHKAVIFAFRKKGLPIEQVQISKVVKQLIQAGFAEKVSKKDISSIEKTVHTIYKKRHNPLKATANVHIDNCPLCIYSGNPSPMVKIKLADNREAKYCMEHNVTIPCIIG